MSARGTCSLSFLKTTQDDEVVNSPEDVDECIHFLLFSRKEEPSLIIINTYFGGFISSPAHAQRPHTIGLLMADHRATLFAPQQIAISILPFTSTIHIYFLLRELPPSCVGGGGGGEEGEEGGICCFLLVRSAFIHFQLSSNGAIVRC